MKSYIKLFAPLLLGFAALAAQAQGVVGTWHGALNMQGMPLRIVFHVSRQGAGYSATMDSPDQGAAGIAATSVSFERDVLNVAVASIGLRYEGTLRGDSIAGQLKQGGFALPLNLRRKPLAATAVRHPQEPTPPYPYYTENVRFANAADSITLAGTLTLPQQRGYFPAVVLISGSGQQNRDEEIMGHKPFLVLADYLARNGIASLRFDDRGCGGSGGDAKAATSLDFARDVEAAITFLKTRDEVDAEQIGLVGHSEGGLIAPMLASRRADVAFIVMLAGPGVRGKELLLSQQAAIYKASGMTDAQWQPIRAVNEQLFDMVIAAQDLALLQKQLADYLDGALRQNPSLAPRGMDKETFVNASIAQLTTPWMREFIAYDPAPALQKVKCPVLAVNGSKDLQVVPSLNLPAIRHALGGNARATVQELPNLNHLFQECTTGLPSEYAGIAQTFAPSALALITEWITNL